MKIAQVHESGEISLIEGDGNLVLKRVNANGQEDKITKTVEVGNVSKKDFHKMMEKPRQFNLNRYGVREIKKEKK